MKKITMNFDGACTNTKQDGDLGIGIHAQYEGQAPMSIFKIVESAGIGTNNEAEYKAMIRGMQELIKLNLTVNIVIIGDSQLVIRQMTGEYKCKDFHLRKLFVEAKQLEKQFVDLEFRHVPREENSLADELAGEGVKRTLVDYINYRF